MRRVPLGSWFGLLGDDGLDPLEIDQDDFVVYDRPFHPLPAGNQIFDLRLHVVDFFPAKVDGTPGGRLFLLQVGLDRVLGAADVSDAGSDLESRIAEAVFSGDVPEVLQTEDRRGRLAAEFVLQTRKKLFNFVGHGYLLLAIPYGILNLPF